MKKYSRLKKLLTPLLLIDNQNGDELETVDHYMLQLNETLRVELNDTGGDDLIISSLLIPAEGRLEDPATLSVLLQANLPGQDIPAISIGLVQTQEQRQVMLWTRHSFSMLDTWKLKVIIESFMARAEQVECWLSLPAEQVEWV